MAELVVMVCFGTSALVVTQMALLWRGYKHEQHMLELAKHAQDSLVARSARDAAEAQAVMEYQKAAIDNAAREARKEVSHPERYMRDVVESKDGTVYDAYTEDDQEYMIGPDGTKYEVIG